MSKVYAFSDCHFGHKNILKYRAGFSSIEEHDNTLVENFNKTVGKRDTVYFFGDIAFDEKGIETLKRLRFCNKKTLILGNHDAQHMNKEQTKEYYGLFDEVIGCKSYKGAWLTHIPIHESELRGKYNIHGHTHGAYVPDTRYFNVCVENTGFAPIELKDVMQRLIASNPEYEKARIAKRELGFVREEL